MPPDIAVDWLRPKAAAARFSVSRATLATWAERGWIGTSKIDGARFYRALDIAELIASGERPRTTLPAPAARSAPASAPTRSSWRESAVWRGRFAARSAPVAR